jgi:sugar lactone lactonase YvrE
VALTGPAGVTFDTSGAWYIAESGGVGSHLVTTGDVRLVETIGTTNGIINTVPTVITNLKWFTPISVALGPRGRLYLASNPGTPGSSIVYRIETNGSLTLLAGGGNGGDGGAATNASLGSAQGVVLDPIGNLYIADAGSNRIRRVDTITGIVTTVAGGGTNGDGVAATNASVNSPYGVALDSLGNIYIAETGNNRIRRVDTNGIITTLAGGHGIGKNGGGYSGDGGAATNAALLSPYGVALDASGGFYIADTGNDRVRRVDADGFIATVAGNGTNGYSGDGGLATNAQLYSPYGVALDASGNFYIADYQNGRIRKVLAYAGYPTLTLNNLLTNNDGNYSVIITSPSGSVTSSVVTLTLGNAPSILSQPTSQVLPVGSNATFRVTTSDTEPLSYQWYFGGTALTSSITNVLTLTNLSTSDSGNYAVVITNIFGRITSSVVSLSAGFAPGIGTQPPSLTALVGSNALLGVTPTGTGPLKYQWRLNGTNLPNNIISTFAGNGGSGYSSDGAPGTNTSIGPSCVALDVNFSLYFGDESGGSGGRVRRLTTNGLISTVAGGGNGFGGDDSGAATNLFLSDPVGIAFDQIGRLYIADLGNQVYRVSSGRVATVAGNGFAGYSGDGGPATNASLDRPFDVAVDALGTI